MLALVPTDCIEHLVANKRDGPQRSVEVGRLQELCYLGNCC